MPNKHTDLGGGRRLVESDDVSENLPSKFCVPSSGSFILLILLIMGRPLYFVMT